MGHSVEVPARGFLRGGKGVSKHQSGDRRGPALGDLILTHFLVRIPDILFPQFHR